MDFEHVEFLAVIISGAVAGWSFGSARKSYFRIRSCKWKLYICLAVPGFMALFFLAIMASHEFRVAGPTTRIAMVGTRNELVTCYSFRLAAHQRTGGLRTTFAEVDVVVRHYRRSGGTSYRLGRAQPDRCGERKRARHREPARSHFVQGVDDRGGGLCGDPVDSHHRGNHIGDEEVDPSLSH